MKISIVYENEDLVVILKPHGLYSVEDRQGLQTETVRSILDKLYDKIYMVHRLDAGTGGLMLCAKNKKMHSYLCEMFEARKVKKEYLAIVKGAFDTEQTLDLPISAKVSHGKYKINFKSGKEAKTLFIPIKTAPGMSLVKVIPLTGRTHQIRVHLKALGHPLYKDWLYNNDSSSTSKDLTLFASKLNIILPDGATKEFSAEMSPFMEELAARIK